MKPIEGFSDNFGPDLRRRNYLGALFGCVAESFGFEPLEVPALENASAYDESVVGLSPWPEWNRRGVFTLDISNYDADYDVSPKTSAAVLIPEGTLSVTRWLGDRLSRFPDPGRSPELPFKICYEITCYRNELLNSMSKSKGRHFTQFGVEILGGTSICSDLEVMCVSAETLRALGVSGPSIRFRISSNRIFARLARESGLTHEQSVALKESLDTIAECKAGKKAERLSGARAEALDVLASAKAGVESVAKWAYVMDRQPGPVAAADAEAIGSSCADDVDYLATISSLMHRDGIIVDVDYCVVRSHEYYTGLTFEIDLVPSDGRPHVEVGGGGRYDRLLGHFIEGREGLVIPSVGYAFGLERLQAALVESGYITGMVPPIPYRRNLGSGPIQSVALPAQADNRELGKSYLGTVDRLMKERLESPITVLFG